jgi:orotidine-5'-phosphate decarboxylase
MTGRVEGTVNDHKTIPPRERLIFALDVPSADDALSLVDDLDGAVEFFKIGLELFVASAGRGDLITEISERGKKVMVDLKFFDVPETVGRAVARLAEKNVTFATVHGNDGMLKAAAENKKDVKILAVTALTSLDEGDLKDLGFEVDVEKLVLSRARRAIELGCDGVVSSGLEAAALRAAGGEGFLIVTPGIRPVANRPVDDQKRTVDVATALRNGADYIVVGRPIRDAADPKAAAQSIQVQIAEVVG